MSSAIDSAYHSPHVGKDCDPIIFGESSRLDDLEFDNLFAVDSAATQENHFAKDTFAVPRLSIEQADFAFGGNDFTFDSMVEFDVDHSSGVGLGLHTSEDFHHFGSNDHLSRPGSSAQNLAESLTQQPSIGASA